MKLVRISSTEACKLATAAVKQEIMATGCCLWESHYYDDDGKLLVVFA